MDNKDTGILLHKADIQLYRTWFKQAVKLLGINVLYRAPREGKQYDNWGELDTAYYEPVQVACIYQDHPTQQTAKKLGWNAELSEGATLIVVPYDLPKLQVGSLFIIPPGIDGAEARVFKVLKMQVTAVYPSEITCELGPMLRSNSDRSDTKDFSQRNMSVIVEETDDDEEEDD